MNVPKENGTSGLGDIVMAVGVMVGLGVMMVLSDGSAGLDYLGVIVLGFPSVLALLATGVLFKCVGALEMQDRASPDDETPKAPRPGSFSRRHG